MKRAIVRSALPVAGAVLMLAAVILLATRPMLHVPRGHDIYIGFAGEPTTEYAVPAALVLAVLGFATILGWGVVMIARSVGQRGA